MLREKAKVSHTHNEKLFSLKLVFSQAYVKVIKSGWMHSWSLVCGVSAASQGVGTQIVKGTFKFM